MQATPLVQRTLIRAGLTPDECRLVSGFRGLTTQQKLALLKVLSCIILDGSAAESKRILLSYEADAKPYHWKCDEPRVTKGGPRS